ncbi:hypothetical protein [Orientia tsutsugamushi]|nr:hypothetical protein [Orientia tsutsugamushi]
MRDVYSFITKAVQQVTSNTTSWVKDCVLIPGDSISEVLISGADAAGKMAFKCYSICGSMFIHYLNKIHNSYINRIDGPYIPMTVLHNLVSNKDAIIKDDQNLKLIFPANFTSGINDNNIVVAKVYASNNYDINATLTEWSRGACVVAPNCSIKLLVASYNEMNANNDKNNLSTVLLWISSGCVVGLLAGYAATLAYKKYRENADITINIDSIEETKKYENRPLPMEPVIEPVMESQYEVCGAVKDSSIS